MRKLVLLVAYAVGFAAGLVLLFRGIKTAFSPPLDWYLALLGFAVYLYAFGRWVLRLSVKPLWPRKRPARGKKTSGA